MKRESDRYYCEKNMRIRGASTGRRGKSNLWLDRRTLSRHQMKMKACNNIETYDHSNQGLKVIKLNGAVPLTSKTYPI